MTLRTKTCIHFPQDQEIKVALLHQCSECVAIGATWVHLRTCQTCGETLCCDSSPNQHATKHFLSSGHPVVTSAELREYWAWCYPDNLFMPLD